jgi:hypothetical protein
MLDSRLYAHQRFGPLSPAAVAAVIPTYHPIYADADPAVLRLVDDTCGHGNFRSWAGFTCHAARLCQAVYCMEALCFGND